MEKQLTFGQRLRAVRKAAGLSQGELASLSGLSVAQISAMENDKRKAPGYDTMRNLATALRLQAHELAGDSSIGVAPNKQTRLALPVHARELAAVSSSTIQTRPRRGMRTVFGGYPCVVQEHRLGRLRREGWIGASISIMEEPGDYIRLLIEDDALAPTLGRGDRLVIRQGDEPAPRKLVLIELEDVFVLAVAVAFADGYWTFDPVIPDGAPLTMRLDDPRYIGAFFQRETRDLVWPEEWPG